MADDRKQPQGRPVDALSGPQATALERLLAGATQRDAAAAANVREASVSHWVNREGPFRRELLARREATRRGSKKALEAGARIEIEIQGKIRRAAWEVAHAHLEGLREAVVKDGWEPSAFVALKIGELAIKLTEIGDPKVETELDRLEGLTPEERAKEFQASLRACFGLDATPKAPTVPILNTRTG